MEFTRVNPKYGLIFCTKCVKYIGRGAEDDKKKYALKIQRHLRSHGNQVVVSLGAVSVVLDAQLEALPDLSLIAKNKELLAGLDADSITIRRMLLTCREKCGYTVALNRNSNARLDAHRLEAHVDSPGERSDVLCQEPVKAGFFFIRELVSTELEEVNWFEEVKKQGADELLCTTALKGKDESMSAEDVLPVDSFIQSVHSLQEDNTRSDFKSEVIKYAHTFATNMEALFVLDEATEGCIENYVHGKSYLTSSGP